MFAKGIPADHVLAGKYRAEATAARQLPERTPAPRLRWDADIADWVVLAFDDIEGRHPQLSPGSPDVGPVLATIARLAEVLTPCPVPDAPPATVELAELVHGWGELATAPPADLDHWTRRHVRDLAALETQWLPAAAGKTLLHGDINGHTPAAAEAAIADVPTWRDTDPAVITSYAAAFAGYWARNSRRPAPPGVPHLRAYQARAAAAATSWVAHRASWL